MRAFIKHQDLKAEFHTAEKCFITEVSNSLDDPAVSIARARVVPGETTRWHRLIGTAERYVIISGEGRVEIGELSPAAVGSGDVVLIPSRCRQRISNTGEEDLVFLVICTPRFAEAAYEDLEASK